MRHHLRHVFAAVVVGLILVAAPISLRAYDVEAHYVWTYYLALHAGFTPRQAFQIASATVAIDGDADTEPLGGVNPDHLLFGASTAGRFELFGVGIAELTPNMRIVNVWSRLHAFAENAYVGSGRMLPASGPSEAEVAMVPNVQAVREANRQVLWSLALREGNPGPFLHFMQDEFAHGPYDNLRGHGLHGHAPDFLANRPNHSWQMTLRTLASLREFLRQIGGTPRPAADVAESQIRRVFDRMVSANGRLWVADPKAYDMAMESLILEPARYLTNAQSLIPKPEGIGGPSPVRAWGVVEAAIREDRQLNRLPSFPETWFADLPPAAWLQYDYLGDGSARQGGINTNRYAVERVRVDVGAPTATYMPIAGSPNRAQEVTLRVTYTIAGLANLPFLSPLPVIEDASISDVGAQARGRLDRGNGTYTIERKVQRSAADLQAGTLVWRVTIRPYGLEPQTKDLTLRFTPPATPDPVVPPGPGAGGTNNYSGSWTCPQRGTLKLTVNPDGSVNGAVDGKPGEHWGGGQRAGGSITGTIANRTLTLTMKSGDGTTSTMTATLNNSGTSFSGNWTWFRGSTQLGTGTWSCERAR